MSTARTRPMSLQILPPTKISRRGDSAELPRTPTTPYADTKRQYECKFCGNFFNRKYNRDVHENTHTRAIALPCTACGKTFSDPSSVMRHFNEQHAEADHPCPVLGCGKIEKRRERLEKHLVKEHSYAKTDLPELPRKTRSKSTSSKQTTSIYSSGSPFSSAPPSNAPSPSYYRATSPPLVRVASPISYLSQTPRSSTPIWNDLPPVHDVYLSKIDTSYLQPESYRRLSPSSNFSESPASSGGAYLPSLSPSPPMPHYYSSNSNSYTSSSPSQFNAQQDFAQPFYTGAPLFRSF